MSYVSVNLLKSVNFGRSAICLSTVGYTLYDSTGNKFGDRVTEGIHEVGIETGIYAAKITFPPSIALGSILWDTGTDSPLFATEQYNADENNGNILDWTAGRWSLEKEYKMMVFYAQDNTCSIARFGLYDSNGNPSLDEVYTRVRNDESILIPNSEGVLIPGPHLELISEATDTKPAEYRPYNLTELLALMETAVR